MSGTAKEVGHSEVGGAAIGHSLRSDSRTGVLSNGQDRAGKGRCCFATGVEVTNPRTADICKRRRVKGLEFILIEKAINFI